MKKQVKLFFEQHPGADYGTLCKVVNWARDSKTRYSSPGYLVQHGWKYAMANGYCPELEPMTFERLVKIALMVETEDRWIEFLHRGISEEGHQKVYDEWLEKRGPIFTRQLERATLSSLQAHKEG